jgi:hypothetical protein
LAVAAGYGGAGDYPYSVFVSIHRYHELHVWPPKAMVISSRVLNGSELQCSLQCGIQYAQGEPHDADAC